MRIPMFLFLWIRQDVCVVRVSAILYMCLIEFGFLLLWPMLPFLTHFAMNRGLQMWSFGTCRMWHFGVANEHPMPNEYRRGILAWNDVFMAWEAESHAESHAECIWAWESLFGVGFGVGCTFWRGIRRGMSCFWRGISISAWDGKIPCRISAWMTLW